MADALDGEAARKLEPSTKCPSSSRLWLTILVGSAIATSALLFAYLAFYYEVTPIQPANTDTFQPAQANNIFLQPSEPTQLTRVKRFLGNLLSPKGVEQTNQQAKEVIKEAKGEEKQEQQGQQPPEQGNANAGNVNNAQPDQGKKPEKKKSATMRRLLRKILKILKFWKWGKSSKAKKKKKELENAATILKGRQEQQAQQNGTGNTSDGNGISREFPTRF